MAQIIIDIPDDKAQQALKSFTDHFGYKPKLPSGADNPENRQQFAKRMAADWMRGIIKIESEKIAVAAAQSQAAADADSIGIQ
jgi:hypothetical protein